MTLEELSCFVAEVSKIVVEENKPRES